MLAGGLLIVVGGVAGARWMAAVGILTGSTVLYAAYRLRQGAKDASAAGTIAIVAGALSIPSMGGWFIGAILAILGGALAIGGDSRARAQPA